MAAATPTASSEVVDADVDVSAVEFDLGHLCAVNPVPLPLALPSSSSPSSGDEGMDRTEAALCSMSRVTVQLLVDRLFSLPTSPLPRDPGLLATLPSPAFRLPRSKPLPAPRVETRWEAFAKLKGIDKKKRSRKVWDEEKGDWAVRFGYGRANDESAQVIVEEKETPDMQGKRARRSAATLPDAPVQDPWTRMDEEKKERQDKNKKKQERNAPSGSSSSLTAAKGRRVPGTIDLAAVQPQPHSRSAKGKAAEAGGAGHVDVALSVAQASTASMGKFDAARHREPERPLRKGRPGVAAAAAGEGQAERRRERDSQMALLTRLVGAGDAEPPVDLDRAVKVKKMEVREDRQGGNVERRGAADAGGGGRGRGRGGRGARGGGRGGGARGGGRGSSRGGRGR